MEREMAILPSRSEGTVPACGHMALPVSSLASAWRSLIYTNALLAWSTRSRKPDSVRRSEGSSVISEVTTAVSAVTPLIRLCSRQKFGSLASVNNLVCRTARIRTPVGLVEYSGSLWQSKTCYSLRSILFFANTDIFIIKICLYTSTLVKSIMDRREYDLSLPMIKRVGIRFFS
jgi:hypothetical protein